MKRYTDKIKEKPFDAVKFMRQIREKYKLEIKEPSNSGVSLIPKYDG